MMVPIDSSTAQRIPVHDAEVLGLKVNWVSSDNTTPADLVLVVTIQIHDDESIDVLADLGIISRSIEIHFCDVVLMTSRLVSPACGGELIDDWVIRPQSEQIGPGQVDVALPAEIHELIFISGSILTVKCHRVLIGTGPV